jgi:hypothetical protein
MAFGISIPPLKGLAPAGPFFCLPWQQRPVFPPLLRHSSEGPAGRHDNSAAYSTGAIKDASTSDFIGYNLAGIELPWVSRTPGDFP